MLQRLRYYPSKPETTLSLLGTTLSLVGGVLSLLIPALINGYPLVYADTSTYLDSGFTYGMPYDRPITYGLFVRFASLNGLSLWPVVVLPSLLLAWLVFRLFHSFHPESNRVYVYAFLTILGLSMGTGLSWNTSQLMPDVFTPIMFLCAILLLTGILNRTEKILMYFFFLLSAAMHLSHLSINLAYLVLVWIIREIRPLRLKEVIRIRPLWILLALSVLAGLSSASSYSKSKHIFLMGAFIEHGIVQRYLDEHCDTRDYQLCAYKDSLPDLAWQFLWDPDSPLQEMGAWQETKEEFNEIIRGTLSSPRYLGLHLKESIKATFRQLARFRIGDGNGVFMEGSQLHERMELHMSSELHAYEHSLQNRGLLKVPSWIHRIHQGIAVFSFLLLVLIVFSKGQALDKSHFQALVVLGLLALVVHAWVCGTFANAIDRLGTKLTWLLPFLLALSYHPTRKLH